MALNIANKITFITILIPFDINTFVSGSVHGLDNKCNRKTKFNINNDKLIDFDYEDCVKTQYKMMPYPRVTNDQLDSEKTFYNSRPALRMIHSTSNENDLETINHFLFQGKENFR